MDARVVNNSGKNSMYLICERLAYVSTYKYTNTTDLLDMLIESCASTDLSTTYNTPVYEKGHNYDPSILMSLLQASDAQGLTVFDLPEGLSSSALALAKDHLARLLTSPSGLDGGSSYREVSAVYTPEQASESVAGNTTWHNKGGSTIGTIYSNNSVGSSYLQSPRLTQESSQKRRYMSKSVGSVGARSHNYDPSKHTQATSKHPTTPTHDYAKLQRTQRLTHTKSASPAVSSRLIISSPSRTASTSNITTVDTLETTATFPPALSYSELLKREVASHRIKYAEKGQNYDLDDDLLRRPLGQSTAFISLL